VVAIVHNATPHEGRLLDRQLSRYFFRSCDAFITLSSSVLDDLSGYHPGAPARTVYHPLYSFFGDPLARDAAISYLKLDPDKKYLLFFGLVRRYKGLDLLLEALAHPLIRPLNIHLLVAGEFYERKLEYEKMIDQLGVGERVIMTDGYVPDADVKYYFSASDMVVLPYRSATQSGVTQVAFQFGCPMLVSDVGGLPELVDHMETGYVTGLSAGEMAGAIHDFYENQRASFFRKNIMERKHRFQWDHVVSELNALGHSPDNSNQT
jgi:glycosyltransferase involved in cell wall biosynthesis